MTLNSTMLLKLNMLIEDILLGCQNDILCSPICILALKNVPLRAIVIYVRDIITCLSV